jgi:hypothetical protein
MQRRNRDVRCQRAGILEAARILGVVKRYLPCRVRSAIVIPRAMYLRDQNHDKVMPVGQYARLLAHVGHALIPAAVAGGSDKLGVVNRNDFGRAAEFGAI